MATPPEMSSQLPGCVSIPPQRPNAPKDISTSRKVRRCEHVVFSSVGQDERCLRKLNFTEQNIVCRCKKVFCGIHRDVASHHCPVQPQTGSAVKSSRTVFGGGDPPGGGAVY